MEVVWYFQGRWRSGRLLYSEDIVRWNSPHETEQLSLEKTKEIIGKIVDYCQKRNIPLEQRSVKPLSL